MRARRVRRKSRRTERMAETRRKAKLGHDSPASEGCRSSHLVTAAGHDLAVINFGVGGAFDVQDSDQSTLEPRQRMIDQDVVSRHVQFEFCDNRAAWRHCHGLNTLQRLAEHTAEIIDLVEHFADDMERRGEVRTADAEENTN